MIKLFEEWLFEDKNDKEIEKYLLKRGWKKAKPLKQPKSEYDEFIRFERGKEYIVKYKTDDNQYVYDLYVGDSGVSTGHVYGPDVIDTLKADFNESVNESNDEKDSKKVMKILKDFNKKAKVKITHMSPFMNGVIVYFDGKGWPQIPSELKSEIFDPENDEYLITLKESVNEAKLNLPKSGKDFIKFTKNIEKNKKVTWTELEGQENSRFISFTFEVDENLYKIVWDSFFEKPATITMEIPAGFASGEDLYAGEETLKGNKALSFINKILK